MLGRQQIAFYVEDEDLRNIMFNIHVNDHFLSLAREVNNLCLYYRFKNVRYVVMFLFYSWT